MKKAPMMERADRKLRLEIPKGELVHLGMKKIRSDVHRRLAMLAARRRTTIEYALDLVLRVGLDAYDEEDGVKGAGR